MSKKSLEIVLKSVIEQLINAGAKPYEILNLVSSTALEHSTKVLESLMLEKIDLIDNPINDETCPQSYIDDLFFENEKDAAKFCKVIYQSAKLSNYIENYIDNTGAKEVRANAGAFVL